MTTCSSSPSSFPSLSFPPFQNSLPPFMSCGNVGVFSPHLALTFLSSASADSLEGQSQHQRPGLCHLSLPSLSSIDLGRKSSNEAQLPSTLRSLGQAASHSSASPVAEGIAISPLQGYFEPYKEPAKCQPHSSYPIHCSSDVLHRMGPF